MKGRPPLEPRIAALEARVIAQDALIAELADAIGTVKQLSRETFSEPYRSNFDKWPARGQPTTWKVTR